MSLNRYDARRDATETAIVSALRKAGCKVLPQDDYDLLVNVRGMVYMLECKVGKGRLTASQRKLIAEGWPLKVVRTPEEALRAVGLFE